ncbi:3-oxoacyl-ACP synthase III family protein [Actinopolymorpha singaporensis]|uniref:3-oxoacyl-[acyl-carrier-protein] synthase-3 n=1 Tax=Actinopolymorpha singaporensis TaxID=117157 RepID=A0A1H1UR97_9ACTN|nr:ketoacyl-ACP synthase III [Actinopolymorpha singaporensis]SDS74790.1 3-oxoacyl-[acyl-carrier-protein] synthase-3 [Actinopolymorpha singaporensis]
MSFVILGTGSDLPPKIVSNEDIERASTDYDPVRARQSLHEWVMQRAGVATRHRLDNGEGTSDMSVRAARRALADAGVALDEIDLLVLGTFTSDSRLPSTVSLVQQALGGRAKCLQLETACTGFVDSLLVATSVMSAAGYRTALVITTEAMSAVTDPERFMYQAIFGDGAAAVVIRDLPGSSYGIEALCTHTDATHCEWTWVPGGGTKHPITAEVLADRSQYVSLDTKAIYRFAVEKMVDATHEVLDTKGLSIEDVDWLIPHQTGANIIAEVVEQLKIPPERVITCLDHTGNVSGASVAIALDEARASGRLADGDRIVVPVVGGGMAWGAVSFVWRRSAAARAQEPERAAS